MNQQGQILLPGLALYLLLLIAAFQAMLWGRKELKRLRLETTAIATSLSVARAQAKLLNDRATFNLRLNVKLNRKSGTNAAMAITEKKGFEDWLTLNHVPIELVDATAIALTRSIWNGSLGYASAVGSQVAKLNGATGSMRLNSLDLKLRRMDMKVAYVMLHPPWLLVQPYAEVYYARRWEQERRHAQPNHVVHWLVQDGSLKAVASAKVYLDQNPENFEHNGGFPRAYGESFLGGLEVQSFFPQFNARRIATPLTYAQMAN